MIVTAYNEERHIGRCLESLIGQDFDDFEVLVVDDGSSDGTFRLAKGYADRFPDRVRVVRMERNMGLGNARNIGAVYARGEVVVFLDADMEFPRDFLGKLVTPILSGEYHATCPGVEIIGNLGNPWVKVYGQKTRGVGASQFIGFIRAIRRDLFLGTGGFDARLGYFDDVSFHEKTGIKSLVVREAVLYHHNPDTAREVLWRNFWIGRSVLRRHKRSEVAVMLVKRIIDLSIFPALVAAVFPSTMFVGIGLFVVFWFTVARHRVVNASGFLELLKLRVVYVPAYRVLRALGFLCGFVYGLFGGGWRYVDTKLAASLSGVVVYQR